MYVNQILFCEFVFVFIISCLFLFVYMIFMVKLKLWCCNGDGINKDSYCFFLVYVKAILHKAILHKVILHKVILPKAIHRKAMNNKDMLHILHNNKVILLNSNNNNRIMDQVSWKDGNHLPPIPHFLDFFFQLGFYLKCHNVFLFFSFLLVFFC